MLWQNHYFRRNFKEWEYNLSPNHSIIFSALPEGELVSFKTISKNVLTNKDNSLVKNEKEIKVLLEDLIKQKRIGELVSEQIYCITR